MKIRKLVLAVIFLAAIGAIVAFLVSKTTTSQSSLSVNVATSASSVKVTTAKPIVWSKCNENILGVSYAYPMGASNGCPLKPVKGDTGEMFGATVPLASGAAIYVYALTKDYSAPKDGPSVGAEGFLSKDGEYYVIEHGIPESTPFVPDEKWQLNDGEVALVSYGKNYDPGADYPEPAARAMINLPGGGIFTGLGFELFNIDNTGSHPASASDLSIFKHMVTSVRPL